MRTVEQIDKDLDEVDAWIEEITKKIQPPSDDKTIKEGKKLLAQWGRRGVDLITERNQLVADGADANDE